jgi:hypothetical protein
MIFLRFELLCELLVKHKNYLRLNLLVKLIDLVEKLEFKSVGNAELVKKFLM